MPKKLKHIILILVFFVPSAVSAQKVAIGIGTDIPYQIYLAVSLETKNVNTSYKTGILVPPFSNAILRAFQKFGTEEIYISLLESSYDFGWMNTLGAYYKFGDKKKWYLGPEFRFDYFTASETPEGILEEITGEQINFGNQNNQNVKGKLAVMAYGFGLRSGYLFELKKNNKHNFKVEASVAKYIATKSTLNINSESHPNLNKYVDEQIWENVFKRNGVIGGIGFSYAYRF